MLVTILEFYSYQEREVNVFVFQFAEKLTPRKPKGFRVSVVLLIKPTLIESRQPKELPKKEYLNSKAHC